MCSETVSISIYTEYDGILMLYVVVKFTATERMAEAEACGLNPKVIY